MAPWTPRVLLAASTQPSAAVRGTPSGNIAVPVPPASVPPVPLLVPPALVPPGRTLVVPATAFGPLDSSPSPAVSQPAAVAKIERPRISRIAEFMLSSLADTLWVFKNKNAFSSIGIGSRQPLVPVPHGMDRAATASYANSKQNEPRQAAGERRALTRRFSLPHFTST